MKKYKLVNTVLGWIIFAIAAIVYLLTIEPTASFWDCSEFISSAYKLEVGHPPGAPVFMLMGNLFSHLASEPSQVAKMLNALSALFSAFTILFLFWTITKLARKIVCLEKQQEMTVTQMITIFGSGAVGAFVYTFSDTFWFSAVEGEVYAFSSFMTAIVVWLILKWEEVADEPHSDRWLILIAYLTGLSIAIHLLNLLCIPTIVLVYYFRKTAKSTWKGALIALLISFGIMASVLFGLVQGLVEVCGWFELLFVNVFSLPYNSGVLFYIIFVFGVLSWAIWETMHPTRKQERAKIAFIITVTLLGIPFIGDGLGLGICIILGLTVYLFWSKKISMVSLNSILIGLFVITIGYLSYALIVIRSTSNTPMDQNSPEDIFTLRTYLSREQYGETPLFYGQTFVSEIKYEEKGSILEAVVKDRGPIWTQIPKKDASERDRYYESGRRKQYVYVDELNTFFPRMFSPDPRHIQGYKDWSNFKGKRVRVSTPNGGKWVIKPTFGENLRYFFEYQVNFMYWRYFMWNFAGRQNDIQGNGEVSNGNWITGIKWIDQFRVGPQDDMPDSIAKNKGHNKYYLLPLLLGILGVFFQVYAGKKGAEQFWVTFLLFFMTGLAIVVYLNQTPYQPRERDYAYAGSFYAFCIWIGIGTAGVIKGLNKYLQLSEFSSAVAGSILCLLVPVQMASQTWDDHDRSGRYLTRDFGMNYLTTCEHNAIIFTNGDNDTFPLWYAQEVEGYRTDVRVCNLSYLQTDWYIDQMKRQAYESDPLPIGWKKYEYVQGKHDLAWIFDEEQGPIPIDRVLKRIKSDDPRDKTIPKYPVEVDNILSYKISIPIDSAAVIRAGLVKPENAAWIPPYLLVDLGDQPNEKGEPTTYPKKYLGKQELMILEMLKNNSDWSRPIYYAITVNSDQYLRLESYFRQDGVAYRIMPFEAARYQRIDSDLLYDNLMNKYRWGNMQQPGLYLDENCMRMARTFRVIFGQLAQKLVEENNFERAEKAVDYCLEVLPSYNLPHDYYSTGELADVYHKIGKKEKADELYTQLAEISIKNLNWYIRLNRNQYASILNEVKKDLLFMQNILFYFAESDSEKFDKYSPDFSRSMERFQTWYEKKPKGGKNR
jgi:tetratricopeptide (TPR) repeat protein